MSWVSEYLEFQGMMDDEIRAIIRRRMWPHDHVLLNHLKQVGERMATKAKHVVLHRRVN